MDSMEFVNAASSTEKTEFELGGASLMLRPESNKTRRKTVLPHMAPRRQEIKFTYIPAGADIVALDAFSRKNSANECVVGMLYTYI